MTLLYEAALKTTQSQGTEDEPSSRPNNVNPTPGVHLRDDYGKSVFVPDASRPGGGVFVAQSQDEKLQAGLQPADIVLASEYGSGSAPGSTSAPAPAPPVEIEAGAMSGQAYYPNTNPNLNGIGNAHGNGMISGPAPAPLYGTGLTGPAGATGVSSPSVPMDPFQNMQMGVPNVNPNINVNLGQMAGMGTENGMVLNAPHQDVSLFPPLSTSPSISRERWYETG